MVNNHCKNLLLSGFDIGRSYQKHQITISDIHSYSSDIRLLSGIYELYDMYRQS